MAHTSGQWECDGTDIYAVDHNVCIGTAYRPRMDDEGNVMPNPQVESNARLMAAAPELLDACHSALGTIQYLLSNSDNGPAEVCMEVLAEAIDKAEGRGER
jgi:hypothetical protein